MRRTYGIIWSLAACALLPPVRSAPPAWRDVPSLDSIVAACRFLEPGDIPEDAFQPPETTLFVDPIHGDDFGGAGGPSDPFATLQRAINRANEIPEIPLNIRLRGGIHYYKSPEDAYLTIERGNLYIASAPGETAVIRPFYWPGPPRDWGEEHAIEAYGDYQNLTFDGLTFEGWSVVFVFGSQVDSPPMRNVTVKNCVARNFSRRNNDPNEWTQFLETGYVDADVYGEGKSIFDDPNAAHFQVEGMLLSNIQAEGCDLGVNVGDENDANVKGLRITRFDLANPPSQSGSSAADALALVNCHKVLIDHCRIVNISDDGIDAKSYDVAVVNCYVEGTGRNAVKFWRNAEMINTILYNVTEIDDGAFIVKEGPFRMVHCLLFGHESGYAGTFAYDESVDRSMEIINSAFGHARALFVNTFDFSALNNRFFDILDQERIVAGLVEAGNPASLNALDRCAGNEWSESPLENPEQGDFRPKADGNWIDAGISPLAPPLAFDFFGAPRQRGAGADIGPVERSTIDDSLRIREFKFTHRLDAVAVELSWACSSGRFKRFIIQTAPELSAHSDWSDLAEVAAGDGESLHWTGSLPLEDGRGFVRIMGSNL